MKLVYVLADQFSEFNTSRWLCVFPANAINASETQNEAYLLPLEEFEKNTRESQEICSKSDVIVIERNFRFDSLTSIMFWKVRGKVVVANFDDAYDIIEETNISFNYWNARVITKDAEGKEQIQIIFPKPLEQFKWGLQTVYAYHTPSRILTKDWKHINPNGYYLPNYFETKFYVPKEKNDDIITLWWGGSLSHKQSFVHSGIIPAMEAICKERPNVRVRLCGDDRIMPLINIPSTQLSFQPFTPYEKWGDSIANGATIGLAPLAGEYDSRRSWIKVIEYMLLRIPFVASKSLSYQELYQYGKFVNNDYLSWKNGILNIIDNLKEKQQIASKLPYEFAIKQDINLHVPNILNLYKTIAFKHAGIALV